MSTVMPARLPLAAAFNQQSLTITALLPPACRLPSFHRQRQSARNSSGLYPPFPPATPPLAGRVSLCRPLSTTSSTFSAHHSPLPSGNPTTTASRKPITIPHLHSQHRKGIPITVLTAHDYPSAAVADAAGIDIILAGDSLAMVALGSDTTTGLTLEAMIHHSQAVVRGARTAFVVADLPMGSYEVSPQQALSSAIRLVKEAGVGAVKLEGGASLAPTIRAVVDAGIPVMAHVGLMPQRSSALGGFRVQGKTAPSAMAFLRDALAVQEAGAFAMVVEAVPEPVARLVTGKLSVPTIGIGAGRGCAGQVLVQIDMLGALDPATRKLPRFVKCFGNVWRESLAAIEAYRDEVRAGTYPADGEHTYPIREEELLAFRQAADGVAAELDDGGGGGRSGLRGGVGDGVASAAGGRRRQQR